MTPPAWSRVEIAGKPADVADPPGEPAPRFAVLWLHPLGGGPPIPPLAAAFARQRLAVCAPWGARAWWLDRTCRQFDPHLSAERHLLDNVLPWVRSRWNLGPREVAVAGVGMGGHGALRFAFRHAGELGAAASLAGALDMHNWYGRGTPLDDMYPDRETCRRDTAILWVKPPEVPRHVWFACDPSDHELYQGNDRLHEKLTAAGVSHTAILDESRGGGEAFLAAMADPLADWLAKALAAESRRLL